MRPQDIIPLISGVSVVKYLMFLGIYAMAKRPQGFSVKQLFEVPMDYLMLGYCAWAVYATPDHMGAAKELFNYLAFYAVTALALSSWKKLELYLTWWLISLGVVSLFALSSHLGFEIVAGSQELTNWFRGRLTLNTWIFRNPNALAHGVIAILPASAVFFLDQGRSSKKFMWGVVLITLGVYCVFLTESKGAFMAGAGALTVALLFKRKIALQITVLALVSTAGFAVLQMLPRMDTLSKKDPGIEGRMKVWQQAKTSMESTITGEGLKGFQGYVEERMPRLHRTVRIPIATHGSYVRHGADLGYGGLMFYVGLFYGGARVLLGSRTPPGTLPRRIQKTLFALLVVHALSAWVVDRAYHTDYYLLMAAIAAFQRQIFAASALVIGDKEREEGETVLREKDSIAAAAVARANFAGSRDEKPELSEFEKALAIAPSEDGMTVDSEAYGLKWRRLGLVDFIMMYILMRIAIYYWNLLSTDFVVF